MTTSRQGILFVISGPSGAGKGTILQEVFRKDNNLVFSVSATTRNPRPGEVDGEHYFFIGNQKFEDMIAKDEFLEYAYVHGKYYGTPSSFVNRKMAEGYDVILDIDVQGALQVMERKVEAVFIFIAPPNLDPEILRQRLTGRKTETAEQIDARVNTSVEEMKMAYKYDYIIFNDILETAIEDLQAVIRAERLRCKRYFGKSRV